MNTVAVTYYYDAFGWGEYVVYVGRTSNFNDRQQAHQGGSEPVYPKDNFAMQIVATGLPHDRSRALEQGLICAYTINALNNAINSIAKKNWGLFKDEIVRIDSLISGLFDD